jgi:choline dehydrogenase-like flavoprotein
MPNQYDVIIIVNPSLTIIAHAIRVADHLLQDRLS